MLFIKMSKVEREVFESEIMRLKKENKDLRKQLAIADRYKDDYKQLCDDFNRKSSKLEKLLKETEELGKEKLAILNKIN